MAHHFVQRSPKEHPFKYYYFFTPVIVFSKSVAEVQIDPNYSSNYWKIVFRDTSDPEHVLIR
ncbi:MAG: hypothetical protein ACI93R_002430 [Flavobacteriales bacterium]|jgi:hypothetical protein